MTGNNKVWRASLAGLASVAMLATMGVVAGTANAATTPDVNDPKVTLTDNDANTPDATITVTYGDSLVDALGEQGKLEDASGNQTTTPDKFGLTGTGYFVGYYGEDGQPFDFTAPLTQDTKVVAKYAPETDVVKVEFQGNYGFYPLGSATAYVLKGTTLDARQAPTDKADGQLTAIWSVTGDGVDKTKITDGTVDSLSKVAVTRPGNALSTVTVKAKTLETAPVKKLIFNGRSNGYGFNSYPLNAYADGVNGGTLGDDLWVDTTADSYEAPVIITPKNTTVGGKKVQAYSAWINEPGTKNTTKVGDDIANVKDGEIFEIDPASIAKYVLVTFDSKGGTLVPAQRVFLDQGNGTYGFAQEPTAPTKDGYVFDGWLNPNGNPIEWNASTQESKYTAKVTADVTLTAKWKATTSELAVTFRDQNYDGKHADVVVKVNGNEFLSKDQAPAWDRAGYVLTGWKVEGRTDLFDFDKQIAADVHGGDDFVLVAQYTQVTEDAVKAALNYVNDGSGIGRYGKDNKDLTDSEVKNTDNKALFTDASFKEFKTVWTKVNKEYQQAQFAAQGDKISKETSSDLVKQLAAAWQKLAFVGDDNVRETSYRFYNPITNEHLFTTNPVEVSILKSNPDWNYEPDGNLQVLKSTDEELFKALAAFGDNTVSKDVKDQLNSVADPLVVQVQRLYNRITNEHLFTTNQAEVDKLSAGDWTLEPANAFYAPSPASSSQKSVYRLYNPILNQHLFTANPAEVEKTTHEDWILEGVEFKAL